jgi:RNA polymerase sigma-70 factor (ECF subfamily)
MTKAKFQALYENTNRQLWRYLYRLVGDAELANDLMQESYMKFLQSSSSIRSDPTARSFLFAIATNLVKDNWRRGMVRGRWQEEHENEVMDESAEHLPLRLDLAAAMEQLSLMHRSLLWLTYVEGYTHQEVAAIQQIQPTSVRVLLARARARLAKICCEMGIEKENRS